MQDCQRTTIVFCGVTGVAGVTPSLIGAISKAESTGSLSHLPTSRGVTGVTRHPHSEHRHRAPLAALTTAGAVVDSPSRGRASLIVKSVPQATFH